MPPRLLVAHVLLFSKLHPCPLLSWHCLQLLPGILPSPLLHLPLGLPGLVPQPVRTMGRVVRHPRWQEDLMVLIAAGYTEFQFPVCVLCVRQRPRRTAVMGTMCCLQECGNTELLPGKSRVAASLKFLAHASWGTGRDTELGGAAGGAWVLFCLCSACHRRPPPGGQDGQMDVAGLSNARGGL